MQNTYQNKITDHIKVKNHFILGTKLEGGKKALNS